MKLAYKKLINGNKGGVLGNLENFYATSNRGVKNKENRAGC